MPTLPPDIHQLRPEDTALFLDCDGTLAQIVQQPAEARIEPHVLELVEDLAGLAAGALAIVSGRSIAQLDIMLAPLKLPVAGVHGAERRDARGKLHQVEHTQAVETAIARSRDFAGRQAGLICEVKPGSVALHYRMRPELEGRVRAFAEELAGMEEELRLLHGKMVVEISGSQRTKGDAIADFMHEEPFAGRLPVFVGDDVTDEDGFAMVAGMRGLGIKIGPGPTRAARQLADLGEFHRWLHALREVWVR